MHDFIMFRVGTIIGSNHRHQFVHDNARNMVSAGNKCPDWDDAGCFAHMLQLCIKPALELPSLSKLIFRARKLIGHFKHSTTVTCFQYSYKL
jgi:hypothetical protein